MSSRWIPGGITPALTERRKRCEFVSGADGKIGEASHPRNEPAPTRDVASVQRFVIPRPTTSLSHILASLANEVEFAQAWPEFGRACTVMFELGRHGQAIRWLFRTVYRCLLPRLRHGRSRPEHVASAFEGIVSMSDYAVAMDSRRDNARVNRATGKV